MIIATPKPIFGTEFKGKTYLIQMKVETSAKTSVRFAIRESKTYAFLPLHQH